MGLAVRQRSSFIHSPAKDAFLSSCIARSHHGAGGAAETETKFLTSKSSNLGGKDGKWTKERPSVCD